MSRIVITMDGGVLQNIEGIPPGVTIEVRDYDTEGWAPYDEEEASRLKKNDVGDEYLESVYTAEAGIAT